MAQVGDFDPPTPADVAGWEKKLEEERQRKIREEEAAEFLRSLSPNDDLVKPIYNPEAYVVRDKARAAASRGDMPRTQCTHPLWQIKQFVDYDPAVNRKDRPLNLFECQVCHTPLWLVDPWGKMVGDQA